MAILDIGNRWRGSSTAARASFIAGIVLITTVFIFGVYWVTRDTYQVLFSDLDSQDAAAIVSEIEKMKVPYRLRDDGRTILVDRDAVYKTRLKIMGNGVLLRGTVGFEIFNNSDFGMTEFAQKINYQRALQGELARTIMGFEEVKFARVHLVLPESGLFKKNHARPKASVTVVTKDGGPLRPEQISGIQRLVAAAVPEVEPTSVTIVDQRGVALTRNPEAEGDPAAVSGRLEIKKEMESYFVRKIADVLDRAFGPAQSIVSVDVTLNHDQTRRTREDVIPYGSNDQNAFGVVTRSRQQTQGQREYREPENRQQSDSSARDSLARMGNDVSTTETEYQSGRIVEQIVSMPGAIKRISVGVLLPNDVDPTRIAKIRDLVAMTVGIEPTRGDAIAVYSVDQFVTGKHGPAGEVPVAAPSPHVQQPAKTTRPAERAASGGGLDVFDALLVLFLACIALVLMVIKMTKKPDTSRKMSGAERDRALAELKQWLATEDAGAGDGRVT